MHIVITMIVETIANDRILTRAFFTLSLSVRVTGGEHPHYTNVPHRPSATYLVGTRTIGTALLVSQNPLHDRKVYKRHQCKTDDRDKWTYCI